MGWVQDHRIIGRGQATTISRAGLVFTRQAFFFLTNTINLLGQAWPGIDGGGGNIVEQALIVTRLLSQSEYLHFESRQSLAHTIDRVI